MLEALDGIGASRMAEPIKVAPDGPLAAARTALHSGEGLNEALEAVEAQIGVARPVLRAAYFDGIGSASGGPPPSVETFERMLCDLHLMAGLILDRQARWDEAQSHLVAASLRARTDQPRLFLVDHYLAQGRHRDALDQLRCAGATGADTAFQLLAFANEMAWEGHQQVAADAFSYAQASDASGLTERVLAARRRGFPDEDLPASAAIAIIHERGLAAFGRGDRYSALEYFATAAAFARPVAAPWYWLGNVLLQGGGEFDPQSWQEVIAALLDAAAIDQDRRQDLTQAALAYGYAARLDEETTGAFMLQAFCLAHAGHYDAAMSAARNLLSVEAAAEERQAVAALLAVIAGESTRAHEALSRSDPQHPFAVLARQGLDKAAGPVKAGT